MFKLQKIRTIYDEYLYYEGAPKKFKYIVLALWAICAVSALLIVLHTWSVITLSWETKPVLNKDIVHAKGYHYHAPVGTVWMSQDIMLVSPAKLYEDGKMLRYGNSALDDIEKCGAGRYSLSGGAIHLSATDNSDPSVNKRQYEISWPLQVNDKIKKNVFVVTLLMTLAVCVIFRKQIMSFISNPKFIWPAIIFSVPFLISRVWYLIDYPIPAIHPDSSTYYYLTEEINSGRWPMFAMRAPLYPLFMGTVYWVSDKVASVILIQNILSYAACMFMVYVIYRISPSMSLLAALGLAGWVSGYAALEHDTSLLSENLYTSLLILSFAFLFFAIVKKRAVYFALSSFMMACVMMTRPAGQYLIVSYIIVVMFMIFNKYEKKNIAGFLLPMPLLILSFCSYNYLTAGTFSISAQAEQELAYTTVTYWEQDSKYPENINAGIREARSALNLEPNYHEILYRSWELQELAKSYLKGHNAAAIVIAAKVFAGHGDDNYFRARKWLRKVSFDAIKKHPLLYLRGVAGRMAMYYNAVSFDANLAVFWILYRAKDIYIQQKYSPEKSDPFIVRLGKEYSKPPKIENISIVSCGKDVRIAFTGTAKYRMYHLLHKIRAYIFARTLWSYLYFAALIISSILIIKSKARNDKVFMIFIATISVLGSCLVASLVEYPQPRYSYTMEWVYYLLPCLILLQAKNEDSM